MKKSKKAIAVLMAISTIGMNVPMTFADSDGLVAFAEETAQGTVTITKQPRNYSGPIGSIATFSVEASGENLTYQWQTYYNEAWQDSTMEGNQTPELHVEILQRREGYKYRCIVRSSNEEVKSTAATLSIGDVPHETITITKQPKNYTGPLGSIATFSVEAIGENLTYQWQTYYNGAWQDSTMEGNQTPELRVEILQKREGYKYRCIIRSSDNEELKSSLAELHIGEHILDLSISAQPNNYRGPVGSTASFSVGAIGNNLSYQWQVNTNGSWTNSTMQGCQTSTIYVEVLERRNGYKYRCIVRDSNGNEVITKAATLTVAEAVTPLKITKQPENYLGPTGNVAVFTVQASGTGLIYKWQVNTTGVWVDSQRDGNQTPSLKVETTSLRDGNMYRCIIKDSSGAQVISDVVTLHIGEKLSITKQPVDYYGIFGDIAKFNVSAKGTELTYQWQINNNGSWRNSAMPGNDTPELSVEFASTRINNKYRCIITDKFGSQVITKVVGFKEGMKLSIANQPVDYVGIVGNTAVFAVEATGTGLTYQWQWRMGDNGEWADSTMGNQNTAALSVNIESKRNGYQYRCIINDKFGNTVTSEAATLTIAAPITLKSPKSTIIFPNQTADFTVSATGEDINYFWEYMMNDGSWKAYEGEGAGTPSITVYGANATSGTQYRCSVTDKYGQTATSKAATLTVADNNCGDELTYDYKDGVLTISGNGSFYDVADTQISPFAALIEAYNITTPIDIVVSDGVESIGAYAFNNISINSITLPESVRIIGKQAFNNTGDTTITVLYPALMFSNDSGIGTGDNIIGYSGSSAEDFANNNGIEFTAFEDEFDDTDHNIYLSEGESTTITAEGAKLRYVSSNEEVAGVDESGNVTAYGEGNAMIFVYDVRGRAQTYNIYVGESKFDLPMYRLIYPGDYFDLVSDYSFKTVHMNGKLFDDDSYWDNLHCYNAKRCDIDEIFSYTEDGQTALTYVNAIADVIDAKNGVEYSGDIQKDGASTGGVWYALKAGDQDVSVDLDITCGTLVIANVYSDYTTGWINDSDIWSRIDNYEGYDSDDWKIIVPANTTYYVFVMPHDENSSGTYTLTANYTEHNGYQISDNENYTIFPSTCGDASILTFTAPNTGNYLIEGISNKQFRYEVSNNRNFSDKEGWYCTKYSDYKGILLCYPLINEGETIYIRAFFDDNVDEDAYDDFISLRVHAVETSDDAQLTVNDFENPDVLSFDPEKFDRRTLNGSDETQYIITIDDRATELVVWDGSWNVIELDMTMTENGTIYYFNSDEETYHVMVVPKNAADKYGKVNVRVSTNQTVDVELENNYSVYDQISAPVSYTFTASEAGYYYFDTTAFIDHTYISGDGEGLYYDLRLRNDDEYLSEYRTIHSEAGNSKSDVFYLEEGKTLKFWFEVDTLLGNDHFDFSVNYIKPTKLTLNEAVINSLDSGDLCWYSFTAPADGKYHICSASYDNPFFLSTVTNEHLESSHEAVGTYMMSCELAEGETMWLCVNACEGSELNYIISVDLLNENAELEGLICNICGGVNGEHYENCSHYYEIVQDAESDD